MAIPHSVRITAGSTACARQPAPAASTPWGGEAVVGLYQGALSRVGKEHGTAVHDVRAGEPVHGQAPPAANVGAVSMQIAKNPSTCDLAAPKRAAKPCSHRSCLLNPRSAAQ